MNKNYPSGDFRLKLFIFMNIVMSAMSRPLVKHEELHPARDMLRVGTSAAPDSETALLAALICVSCICAVTLIGLICSIRKIRQLRYRPAVADTEAQTAKAETVEGGCQATAETADSATQKHVRIEGTSEGTFAERMSSVINVLNENWLNGPANMNTTQTGSTRTSYKTSREEISHRAMVLEHHMALHRRQLFAPRPWEVLQNNATAIWMEIEKQRQKQFQTEKERRGSIEEATNELRSLSYMHYDLGPAIHRVKSTGIVLDDE